jgi:hypothetical protein
MSHCQNNGQKHNIKVTKKNLKNVTKFIYMGTIMTCQNRIFEEDESRCNSGLQATTIQFRIFYPPFPYKKGKVVPVLSLTEHHAMKAYWEAEL